MTGTVYLVGAGPGAADLLTVRAVRLLESADVVLYDALVGREIVQLADRAECIAVGKRCGALSSAQAFINKRLVDAARKYAVVVRLKGGDPMLFGRAQEEIDALDVAGIRYEIVPGVTAAFAAAAELGISLTARGVSRSLALITPRIGVGESSSAWLQAATGADTVAIYMGRGQAQAIADALIDAGRAAATPVAVVANASLPTRSACTGTLSDLARLATQCGDSPALILVGEVTIKSDVSAQAATDSGRRAGLILTTRVA